MKNKIKKSIISILSAAALSCSGMALGFVGFANAATASVTKNAADVMSMNGLTATYNVSGSEKHTDLTNDTSKGILFTSNEVGDSALNASVAFTNSFTGAMELNFRVFTEVTDSASDWWVDGNWYDRNNAEELREIAITVTDVETEEAFTVYIKGGTSAKAIAPNARVAYGDVGANYGSGRWYRVDTEQEEYYKGGNNRGLANAEYNTELLGTTFTNRARHASGWIGAGYSTNIGFDPVTKVVYAYTYGKASAYACYKRPILDLDDPEDMQYLTMTSKGGNVNAALPTEFKSSTFENYTVKMTVTEMTDEKTAKFIVYNLNGQSLGGENGVLTSSVAPGLSAKFTETAKQYEEYTLPTPTVKGVLGETATFDGKVKVLDSNGDVVIAERAFAEGIKFTPELFGEYTVVYSGMKDANGNVRKSYTKNGYTGGEFVYSYPLTVEKMYDVTANASEVITASGLNVTYDVSGSEQHTALTYDTSKGIMFTTQSAGADAVGASVAFKNSLTGTMELNFRVFSEVTDSASDWWVDGNWYDRNNAEELREIAITVTDSETNEAFTVYIKGGTSAKAIAPNARVAYGDVGANYGSGRWYRVDTEQEEYYKGGNNKGLESAEYNTELLGTTFTNRARHASDWIGAGYSTNIGFDPVTKVVYAYTYGTGAWECEKRPILDLDDSEDMQYLMMTSAGKNVNAALPETFKSSTFKNYTVKMTVTEMADEKTAKFIVYNLNGQSLRGKDGKLMSDAGYGMYLPEAEARFVGLEDNFPMPYASSVLTGEKAFTGTIEIVDENGNVVLQKQAYSENVKFVPSTAGNYVAYYGDMFDENDCVRPAYSLGKYEGEERFAYSFEAKEFAIETMSYDDVMKKMGVELGAKVLREDLTAYLTIKKDGAVYNNQENVAIGANYTYTFQDNGEYELVYTVKNTLGNQVSYSMNVEVVAMIGQIKTAESVVMLGEDSIWDKDDFTVYYFDEGEISDFLLTAKVYDGENWIAVNDTPATSVNLKDVLVSLGKGEWTVAFEVSKNGDTLSLEKVLSAEDGSAPVISVESFDEGFISVPEKDSETVKNFVVLEGTVSAIPTATAVDAVDGAVAVKVLLKTPTDSSAQEVSADTSITFTAGEYVIVYQVADSAGNESSFFYFVTVKTLWLTVTAEVDTLELGSAVVIPTPNVVNGFTGAEVSEFDWTAKVYFNGEELEKVNGEYLPNYTGEYEIVYNVTYAGASQDYTLVLNVDDTTKPVITVDGSYVSEAKAGDAIAVLEAEVTDKSTCSLIVAVTYNNVTKVEVKDNQFVVDKAGKYVIKYSVTDVNGNTDSVEFTITVVAAEGEQSDSSQPASMGCFGSAGSLAAIGTLITFIGVALLRKKEN